MAFVTLTIRVTVDLMTKIEARIRAQSARRPGLCKSDVVREILAEHFIKEAEGEAACDPQYQTPK